MMLNRLAALGVAAAAVLVGGCGAAGPGKYNVAVKPGEGLREAGRFQSFEVDLIGANKSQADVLRSYPLQRYFSGSDQERNDAPRKTLAFTADSPGPKELLSTDPIWKEWLDKGATDLVVLSSIGSTEARRRLILPLATDRWEGRTFDIEVQRSGLINHTREKPQK
jgi:hypothetical protein